VERIGDLKYLIIGFIDWLYIPFRKLIPDSTFRYAVCGGFNTSLDLFLYFLTYNFILKKRILDLKVVSISPHIAAFLLVFPITFFTGFLLSKYITFSNSVLRGKIQLIRYGLTVLVCIILNYFLLKFFVDYCHFFPTVSKLLTTGLVIIYSFFSQKYFTFKIHKTEFANLPLS
jgi:putative flippase GtrA